MAVKIVEREEFPAKGTRMTVSELKERVYKLTQKEAVDLICQLYKTGPAAENLLNARFNSLMFSTGLYEETRAAIRNSFFPRRGRMSLRNAKAAISAFEKVCKDLEKMIDLELYYVECGVDYTNEYGDINEAFYNSIEGMYQKVADRLFSSFREDIYRKYEDRMRAVVEETGHIGWGFHDTLREIYEDLQKLCPESSGK